MYLMRSMCLLIVLLLACTARQPSLDEYPPEVFGRFPFVLQTREGIRMTGVLDVAPDTMVVRSESATCRVAQAQSEATLTYECNASGTNMRILLNRRYPTRRSTWSYLASVKKKRDVCVMFRTLESGSRQCTATMPEEYFEQEWRSGELVVTR
jgi:hypothetical protein